MLTAFSRKVPQIKQFEENIASLSRHTRPTATSPEVQFAFVTLFIPGSPPPDQRILGPHLSRPTTRGSRGSLPLPDRGSGRPGGHCFAGGAPRRAHISATGGRTRLQRKTSRQAGERPRHAAHPRPQALTAETSICRRSWGKQGSHKRGARRKANVRAKRRGGTKKGRLGPPYHAGDWKAQEADTDSQEAVCGVLKGPAAGEAGSGPAPRALAGSSPAPGDA